MSFVRFGKLKSSNTQASVMLFGSSSKNSQLNHFILRKGGVKFHNIDNAKNFGKHKHKSFLLVVRSLVQIQNQIKICRAHVIYKLHNGEKIRA